MWITTQHTVQANPVAQLLRRGSDIGSDIGSGMGTATRRFDANPTDASMSAPGQGAVQGQAQGLGPGWGWMQVRCDDAAAHGAVAQPLLMPRRPVPMQQGGSSEVSGVGLVLTSSADSEAAEADDSSPRKPGHGVVHAILRYLDPLAETA